MTPLSITEASEYMEEEVKGFFKKFSKTSRKDAEKMRKELEELGNMKIKQEHIAKIIDLLPEDNQDVAKIFNDVGLDENETNKVLDIVKKVK